MPSKDVPLAQSGPVRNLDVIIALLGGSELPSQVQERSVQVFTALGHAEANTHGSTIDQVCVCGCAYVCLGVAPDAAARSTVSAAYVLCPHVYPSETVEAPPSPVPSCPRLSKIGVPE